MSTFSLKKYHGTLVRTRSSSRSLGMCTLPILNPQNGVLLAHEVFSVSSPLRYILPTSVLSLESQTLIISSSKDLLPSSALPEFLRPFVRRKFSLLGLPAESVRGHSLGNVSDALFDLSSHRLSSLTLIRRRFFFFKTDPRIIPANRIIRLTRHSVTIQDDPRVRAPLTSILKKVSSSTPAPTPSSCSENPSP